MWNKGHYNGAPILSLYKSSKQQKFTAKTKQNSRQYGKVNTQGQIKVTYPLYLDRKVKVLLPDLGLVEKVIPGDLQLRQLILDSLGIDMTIFY